MSSHIIYHEVVCYDKLFNMLRHELDPYCDANEYLIEEGSEIAEFERQLQGMKSEFLHTILGRNVETIVRAAKPDTTWPGVAGVAGVAGGNFQQPLQPLSASMQNSVTAYRRPVVKTQIIDLTEDDEP